MVKHQRSKELMNVLVEEWLVTVKETKDRYYEMSRRALGVWDKEMIYRDMPRSDQILPLDVQMNFKTALPTVPWEPRDTIEVPNPFWAFSSPATKQMLSIILDSSNARLRRMMAQPHTRYLFKENRYYQLIDDPNLYTRELAKTEVSAFHCKSMLYLTSLGIMIYLKRSEALLAASTVLVKHSPGAGGWKMQHEPSLRSHHAHAEWTAARSHERMKSKKYLPFFDVTAYQYATHVHCTEGDILRFQLDFLAIKRHFYDAFPYLMQMEWHPNAPSLLLYRRRYYQFMTPFLDWVDTIRYCLKKSPTLSVASIYNKMLDVHSKNLTLRDLLYQGRIMLEYFEVKLLQDSADSGKHNSLTGNVYAGRKILYDKEPKGMDQYKTLFSSKPVRPVIPNACSPTRRLLIHLYYYDKDSMSTMAQVLSVVESMLHQDFFSMHPLCKLSNIHLEPLIFQIYDFVWLIRKSKLGGSNNTHEYLRHECWEDIKRDDESLAWYLRWDVMNCVSLLFGICQNALLKDFEEVVIDRIVKIIIEVLIKSEYLQSVMSYSFYDTYFGLTSTVNCVPNLQSTCVLRVLKRLPLYLVENFKAPVILSMFTPVFWKDQSFKGVDNLNKASMERITEYLVTRDRRLSMQAPKDGAGENISQTSAMGASGSVTLFCRGYEQMQTVTIEEEQALDKVKQDSTRKEGEERKHRRFYKRVETDFRYGKVFTDSFYQTTGRPPIFLNESQKYEDCRKNSMKIFANR